MLSSKTHVFIFKNRLFRLKEDYGIIIIMGFNNDGLEIAIQQLKKNKGKLIIGGNIGKNTQTSSELYTRDYELCLQLMKAVLTNNRSTSFTIKWLFWKFITTDAFHVFK